MSDFYRSRPISNGMKEIGKVVHWYDKIGVAVIKLSDSLKEGDKIKVKKGDEEFEDTIASIQLEHETVKAGKAGQQVAVKLSQKAKEGAVVSLAE
jgi:ribosomal 50S subunit-recycling heat shock protein